MSDEARRAIHTAISEHLDEGEICVGWCIVLDVVAPDEVRYLQHRAGGGVDGSEPPTVWAARGMLQTSADVAADQLRDSTEDAG
jgi:hypothetical protein